MSEGQENRAVDATGTHSHIYPPIHPLTHCFTHTHTHTGICNNRTRTLIPHERRTEEPSRRRRRDSHTHTHTHTHTNLHIHTHTHTQAYVTTEQELLSLMSEGQKNRAVAATGMNEGSSRSHSIFLLTLTQKDLKEKVEKSSKLVLVDLAGSEMVHKVHTH